MPHALSHPLVALLLALFLLPADVALANTGSEAKDAPQAVAIQTYLWEAFPTEAAQSRYTRSSDGSIGLRRYEPPQLRYLGSRDRSHPLQLAARRLSPVHHYRGPSDFRIVKEIPGAEAEPPLRTTVAQTRLPENTDSVILFLFPVRDAATEQYHIVPVRNSASDIPAGSAQVINLCDEQLAVGLAGKAMLAEPGTGKRIDLSAVENHRLPVIIGSRDADGNWQRRHAEEIIISPKASALFVFYKDDGNYRVLVLENRQLLSARMH